LLFPKSSKKQTPIEARSSSYLLQKFVYLGNEYSLNVVLMIQIKYIKLIRIMKELVRI